MTEKTKSLQAGSLGVATKTSAPTPDTPAHTPLPLSCTHNSWERSTIYDAEGYEVCTIAISWEADEDTQEHFEALKDAKAAFIVRACNSHYSLIEAVERLLNMPGDIDTECNPPEMQQRVLKERLETWQFARAALSQAGGASE